LESVNTSQSQEKSFLEIDAAERKFKEVNKKVSTLLTLQQEHTTWSSLFLSLNTIIPEGILLEKLVTTNQQISLSGKATTRDILLQFQDKLNQSDCFKNAKIPLSDLFIQENVDFQLDVEIKKECLKPGNL
jgi:Tfp pilus assembly protein PilN